MKMNKILLILGILSLILINGCTQEIENNQETEEIKQELLELKEEIKEMKQEVKIEKDFKYYYDKGVSEFYDANEYANEGDVNFEISGRFYDKSEYQEAIDYCVLARDSYSLMAFSYANAKAFFEEAEDYVNIEDEELLNNYIKASEIGISFSWAIYESCEYYEGAYINYEAKEIRDGNEILKDANKKIRNHN